MVHKFSALRPVNQENLPQDAAVAIPWRLDLSLRTPEASELHQLLLKLSGNGITQLADQIGQSAALTVGQRHLPTVEEVTKSVMTVTWANPGTQCYLHSVILAQTWSCTMSQTFNTAIWGPWEARLLDLLVGQAGRLTNPCDASFLGTLLTEWFDGHSADEQHDAGEFAGWYRQKMLEKILPRYMQAGWSARLEHSMEDAANVFAPIPLACDAIDFVMLQQLISDWHTQQPFVHALDCDSPWVCFQISRYTTPGVKNPCSVAWDRTLPLNLPVFRDRRGLQVEWHEFTITKVKIPRMATTSVSCGTVARSWKAMITDPCCHLALILTWPSAYT